MNPNFLNNLPNMQQGMNFNPLVNQNMLNLNPNISTINYNNINQMNRPMMNIPTNVNLINPSVQQLNSYNNVIPGINMIPSISPINANLNPMNNNIKDKLEYVRKVYIGKFPPTLDNNFLIKLLEVSFYLLDMWCYHKLEKINRSSRKSEKLWNLCLS